MASADDARDLRSERTIADNQDSLALIIAQVEHAERVAQQTPVVIREEEGDSVFLCGFASEDSFVGSLDDEDGITDEGIKDFIRENNPNMFRRLFTPEDVTTEICQEVFENCTGYHNSTTTTETAAGMASHDLSTSPKYVELQHTLLQLKRLLVSSLLGGHVLVLQKLTVSYTICCGHPFCRFSDVPVLRGHFVLELRLEGAPQVRHFCLACVESVFSCRAANGQYHQSLPLASVVALDGMAEVLDAAQRLATSSRMSHGTNIATPSPKSAKILPLRQKGRTSTKNYFRAEFPFDYPSNSSQALSLRRRRDAEINEILQDVRKYDERRRDDNSQRQKSPLVITPPPQLPGEDRYKKQGLGRYDKEKERKINGKRDTNSGGSDTFAESTESTGSLSERICHCREAAGVRMVIKCGAEFCSLGSYHLQCTGLLQKPAADTVWYCSNCSGPSEGFVVPVEFPGDNEMLSMEVDDDDYGYDSGSDEILDDEEDISHGYRSDSDRMSLVTGRSTSSLESPFDTESIMSLPTGTRNISTEERSTPPRDIKAVNAFTPINPRPPLRDNGKINSFTPINPDRTPGTVTHFSTRHTHLFSLDGTSPITSALGAACLPVGWSDIVFEDLAPFIIAETNVVSLSALSLEHVGMLEIWRAACPASRLLPGQRPLSPFHTDNIQSVPLSHLLATVDLETARHQIRD